MSTKTKTGITKSALVACAALSLFAPIGFTGCPGDDIKALQLNGIDLSDVSDRRYEGKQDTSLI